MLGAVIFVVIHTQHQSDVFVLGGGRDDDFLDAVAKVLFSVSGVGKASGGLDNHLRANTAPGQFCGVFFGENLDGLAGDADAVGTGRDLMIQIAKNRVVLQKMSQGFGIGKVIDRNKFKIGIV